MSTNNRCFCGEIRKIFGYSSYIPMITVFDGSHNYYSSIQYILSEHFLLKGTGYTPREVTVYQYGFLSLLKRDLLKKEKTF